MSDVFKYGLSIMLYLNLERHVSADSVNGLRCVNINKNYERLLSKQLMFLPVCGYEEEW